MLRTYKYRLRPTPQQEQSLDFQLWQSRRIYNAALEERIAAYQATGKGIGYTAQWTHFRDQRRENPETFGKLNASCLQHTLRRLDKAFAAFFRRLKAGKEAGHPRFKSRKSFRSFEYTYSDGCKLVQKEQGQRRLYLQNVGEVSLYYHRGIPDEAKIKHAVVKRVNERWYVCLMLELPNPAPRQSLTGHRVGVDIGLKALAALSTGELIGNPRWLRESLAKLRVLARHSARQVKGSQRQQKTYRQMARVHEKVANQRRDYLHKLSTWLVTENDLIVIEDLSLAFMNRNEHLSLASYEAGFGQFRQMLEYKAESAGIPLIPVNPKDTSQNCSRCGKEVPKGLKERVHTCPACGLVLDRDVNAAVNILKRGLSKPPGLGGQPGTRAVAPCVG
jgi:putative transposase